MKKKLFVVAAIAAVLLIIIVFIYVSIIYKNKVDTFARYYVNNHFQSEVSFSSKYRLSSRLTNFCYSMEDVVVVGNKGDTIAEAEKVEIFINLLDILRNNMELKAIVVKEGRVIYADDTSGREVYIYNLGLSIDGRINKPDAPINVSFEAGDVTLVEDSVVYLHNSVVNADIDAVSDASGKYFHLADNRISLNGLDLRLEGGVGINGKSIDSDISFSSDKVSLHLIEEALLPVMFETDFETSGEAILSGTLKGLYNEVAGVQPLLTFKMSFFDSSISLLDESQDVVNIEVDGDVSMAKESGLVKSSLDLLYVKYADLEVNNVKGNLFVHDHDIVLEEISFDLFDGKCTVSGNMEGGHEANHNVKVNMTVAGIDIEKAMTTLETFKMFIPSKEVVKGRIDLTANIEGVVDEHFTVQPYTIIGDGKVSSDVISVEQSVAFENMRKILQLGNEYTSSFQDIDVSYTISNGRVYIKPFDTEIGNLKMNVSGDHGIDNTLNYLIKAKMPREDLGSSVNSLINMFSRAASSFGFSIPVEDEMKVNIKITGSLDKPVITPLL